MTSDRPLRVLHVFNYFKPDFTGEGIYVTTMMPMLHARGIRSEILVKRSSPAAEGSTSHRESEPVEHTIHYLSARRSSFFHAELQLLWWMLRFARRHDVIHFHSFCDRYFLSHLVARIFRCRVICSCTLDDDPGAVLRSYHPVYRGLVRQLFRLVHAFVAISPKLQRDGEGVVAAEKMRLIPQGVIVPAEPRAGRAEMRAAAGLGDDDVALLFVGGLCERKNPDFLISALAQLSVSRGAVHLYLVGPVLEEEYAEKLRRMTSELGLAERVHFEGFTSEPSRYYAMADVMVFASTNEGFGNVLIEGMAHALPLVVRRLPGVTDTFIADGETGFLFDDQAGYLAALERLIEAPELGERLGAAAHAAVLAGYDLETIAGRYVELYRE